MTKRTLTEPSEARAKRLTIIGALTLWVACPVVLGAWITVAVRLADDKHVSAVVYLLMALWALVCFAVLIAGFAFLVGGIFFWWRSNHAGGQPRRDATRSSARTELLRQLRAELRDEEGVQYGSAADEVRADDSDAGVPRR